MSKNSILERVTIVETRMDNLDDSHLELKEVVQSNTQAMQSLEKAFITFKTSVESVIGAVKFGIYIISGSVTIWIGVITITRFFGTV